MQLSTDLVISVDNTATKRTKNNIEKIRTEGRSLEIADVTKQGPLRWSTFFRVRNDKQMTDVQPQNSQAI